MAPRCKVGPSPKRVPLRPAPGCPPPVGERHDLVPLREVSKISYAGIGPKGALNTGDGHGTGAVPITPFWGRRGHHIPRDQALRISLSLQPLEDLLPAAAPLPALKQVMDPGSENATSTTASPGLGHMRVLDLPHVWHDVATPREVLPPGRFHPTGAQLRACADVAHGRTPLLHHGRHAPLAQRTAATAVLVCLALASGAEADPVTGAGQRGRVGLRDRRYGSCHHGSCSG